MEDLPWGLEIEDTFGVHTTSYDAKTVHEDFFLIDGDGCKIGWRQFDFGVDHTLVGHIKSGFNKELAVAAVLENATVIGGIDAGEITIWNISIKKVPNSPQEITVELKQFLGILAEEED